MRALLLSFVLFAPFALASHTPTGRCDSDGSPALGVMEFGGPYGEAPIFYVDNRGIPGFGMGSWVYQETNGLYDAADLAHSLQRGGISPLGQRDTCVDEWNVTPDTLLLEAP